VIYTLHSIDWADMAWTCKLDGVNKKYEQNFGYKPQLETGYLEDRGGHMIIFKWILET